MDVSVPGWDIMETENLAEARFLASIGFEPGGVRIERQGAVYLLKRPRPVPYEYLEITVRTAPTFGLSKRSVQKEVDKRPVASAIEAQQEAGYDFVSMVALPTALRERADILLLFRRPIQGVAVPPTSQRT